MDVLHVVKELGVVPVIRLDRAEDAVPVCSALAKGGLPIAEITFRTDAAAESIRRVANELPEVLPGAGTVVTVAQAEAALDAGAKFIVSPGISEKVVTFCQKAGVPIIPGCATPTDITLAVEMGLEVVKFFPAEAMGGIKTLKALAAPFSKMRFMPTGGVTPANLREYLSLPCVVACGGTWLVKGDPSEEGALEKIEGLAREAVSLKKL